MFHVQERQLSLSSLFKKKLVHNAVRRFSCYYHVWEKTKVTKFFKTDKMFCNESSFMTKIYKYTMYFTLLSKAPRKDDFLDDK